MEIKEFTPTVNESESPVGGEVLKNLKELTVGAGSTVFKINKEGVFCGADNYTDAPFSLSFQGSLKATTGTFSGTLSAAAGSLGAITIGSNAWHVDSSGNMWWGSSSTYAGATYKISAAGVANLSGIVAASVAAENITAGTITGCTVQSSSGNDRVELTTGDSLIFYYGGNNVGSIISNSAAGILLRGANIDLSNTAETQGIHTFTGTGPYIAPKQNNTWGCGTASYAWQDVYAYVFHDLCLWLDEEDDLAILKACQPMKDADGNYILDEKSKKPRMDNATLPKWIKGEKNEKGEYWRDMGHFVDLVAGAVRQVADRVDKLEKK